MPAEKIETYVRASDGKVRYSARPWDVERHRALPSKSFDTESEAYAHVRQAEGRVDADYAEVGIAVKRRRSRTSWAAFCAHWAATYNDGEKNSRRTRASHARALAALWPNSTVDEITEAMVRGHLRRLEDEGRSAGTRSGRLAVLRAIMRRAIDDGHREDDPCRNVKGPRVPRRPKGRPLTDDEIDRIIACMPEWLRPAILLAVDSGLRISEVCGLRWSSVSLEMRLMKVGDIVLFDGSERDYPKGKDVLPVPLSERCVAALTEHRKRYPARDGDHVFREPKAGGLRVVTKPQRVRELFARARSNAWLSEPLPRFHDLRHGCAQRLVDAQAAMPVLQSVMRHASLATTARYLPEVPMRDMRAAIDAAAARRGRRTA